MELETTFLCAYCFSVNDIVVDSSGGLRQEYTEDCQVCCRPNKLLIIIDDHLGKTEVSAEPE